MAGATIDHMVSITVLVAALLLTMGIYNQMLASAFAYERNRQVAIKAVDIMDTICLCPGNPTDWGQNNSTPLGFGLQDPESAGYVLSPFSIMRLLSSGGEPVYYPKTNMLYSNVSMGEGGYLLMPIADCINYTTAARLLGVNGSYGFQLSIMPTVKVSVSEVNANPLRLKVEVRGPGLALSGATLNYYLYRAIENPGEDYPLIETFSGTNQTDSAGLAFLEFPTVGGSQCAYSIIVYAHLGGLVGVGYASYTTIENNHLIPFVEDFEDGKVLLAHSWDVNTFPPPVSALHYNATFLLLTEEFELRQIQIANSSGKVNYGEGKPFGRVQIPTSEAGILLVSYRRGDEDEYGMLMMPWGISTLGVSVAFGDAPSGREWVATELRQVIVNDMSYQVKLAVWRLED